MVLLTIVKNVLITSDGGNPLQCIHIPSHLIVHFKYITNFICQLYLGKAEKM